MHILLWGVFYIIATLFLLFFFFKEKQVLEFTRKKEDNIIKKLFSQYEDNKELQYKNKRLGDLITILGYVVTLIFLFLVDKTPDRTIKIKIYGVYGVFLLNFLIYVFRKEHEWIFIINLVMLFLGRLMFNIQDTTFYIYLVINIVISLALIYFYRKMPNEEITKDTLLEEARKNSDKYKDITVETVEVEKRKRSTLGKALSRIDTTITAIVLVGLIQLFYIGNYVIPSGSMEPTIQVQDRVFANMIKYKFKSPAVGEIIAFKEPMNNQVMYTKRLTGISGITMQIVSSRMVIDDKVSEILNRSYEPEGLFSDNKIYVPKKGDKIKLDKIIMLPKLVGYADEQKKIFISAPDWNAYEEGQYEELTPTDFLGRIGKNSGYKTIIGNENDFAESDNTKNVYYTFTLKVEGRDELVLPIMDFKYDDVLFNKLLNGETITLKDNYYMAMGDNTQNSYDSRYFGYVAESRIRGELLLRWWPLTRVGLL